MLRALLIHPGTQHAPRLASELCRQGLLWRFWTGFAQSLSTNEVAKSGRVVDLPRDKLRTMPWLECSALLLARLPLNREAVWHWRNGLFQKLVPTSELQAADVVIGFDTSAWILAARAKKLGKAFVLDQTVAHPMARAAQVRAAGGKESMWPEAFVPRLEKVSQAEAKEHELADLVVVASSFSRKTLVANGVAKEKIRVLPYGVGADFLAVGASRCGPIENHTPVRIRARAAREERAFRFLYAGYLTKRKGVSLLLEVWNSMCTEQAELHLAGGGLQDSHCGGNVMFLGQTGRAELLREMEDADAFVFPSLFEGFALVILEAMAAGLPVITTPNTAGQDLIDSGKDGLIVPAGDVNSLRDAMASLLNDPDRAKSMGRAAHERAKEYTWEKYGEGWGAILREVSS